MKYNFWLCTTALCVIHIVVPGTGKKNCGLVLQHCMSRASGTTWICTTNSITCRDATVLVEVPGTRNQRKLFTTALHVEMFSSLTGFQRRENNFSFPPQHCMLGAAWDREKTTLVLNYSPDYSNTCRNAFVLNGAPGTGKNNFAFY